MLHKIYAIHDITAELYTQPFYAVNDQTAIRSAQNLVQNPGTTFYDNPEDFRLYSLGVYNDETAEITQNPPVFIIRLSDLMIKNHPEENQNEN